MLTQRTIIAIVVFLSTAIAMAGGGPENVLLVVNPRSPASLAIANHYIQLREIPSSNVLFLPWDPHVEQTDIETFRKQILFPILRTIDERHLGQQIDYVVYSSDFPWGVNLLSDGRRFVEAMKQAARSATAASGEHAGQTPEKSPPGKFEWPKVLTLVGSLTGLTYLWQPVGAGHSGYLDLRSNTYMRTAVGPGTPDSTIAFRASREYDPHGKVVFTGGRRYLLSTMLGVTAGRGNTLPEVLSYLKRSAAADGSRPTGTIYFLQNGDIRSKVRHAEFPSAVRQLKAMGVNAEIIDGVVPPNRQDVQGAVVGIADFNWKASGSIIRPGAICEHFTSFGGIMSKGAGQTPLSEFLRYGAAAASGTVTEPYALAEKFPSPMIQVHYARGCSLAEAFYQSVHGPYQLLIVGDPLCRPWATIPQVSVSGVTAGTSVRGRLELKPSVEQAANSPSERPTARSADQSPQEAADHFELFVDGLRRAECPPGETLSLDTTGLPDGYHELRVVAVGPAPIESQGRQIIPVRFSNHGVQPATAQLAEEPPRTDKPVLVDVRAPGAVGIVLLGNGRLVGRVTGQQGQISIPANTLGAGPVRLQAVALGPGDVRTHSLAYPLDVTVQ
ncbi:MAG: hypothetical protein LLG00_02385 [Planctomycetaceae bacterium]|nr:hypothetical protein [Planctomycetaceae bacterium]